MIFDRFSSMEGEACSEGENNRKRGGTDDDSNENNNNNSNHGISSKIVNSNEGQSKPKRQMKTPFQLETLEKAYAGSFLALLLFLEFCNFQFSCVFVLFYICSNFLIG